MTIRVVIVDDEPLARLGARDLLAAHADLEVVAECASATEARSMLPALQPDLLLLDVQMPRLSGIELVQLLGDAPLPLVVFISAFEHFAIEAFDTRAVDYVLKPVRPERLARALDRVRAQLAAHRGADDTPSTPVAPPQALQRIAVRSGDRTVFVPVARIDGIESAGNYAIVSAGSERHVIRETLQRLEAGLPPGQFVRLNRSLLVRATQVVELLSEGGGQWVAIMADGRKAAVTVGVRQLEQQLRYGA